MNSIMHFFPRDYLPTVVRSNERNIVTLPTGEQVVFDAMTHEVVGGVFLWLNLPTKRPISKKTESQGKRTCGQGFFIGQG